jgi:nucleoside-diphosphate-sugar epimerase
MKVLVTGATGFVASHLIPRLAAEGHDVLALGYDADRIPSGDRIEPVVVDLRERLDDEALPEFEAVVHLAQANVPFPEGAADLFRVNATSTVELLAAARSRSARRFVYASSGSVYGFGDGPVAEDDERRADDFYAVTKRAGELAVAGYRDLFSTTVLRLFAPYGPGQRNRLIPGLIERVRNGDAVTLRAGGRPRMTPVFVDDVLAVILRALESGEHHLMNVAGDETVSIRELAELIGAAVGREPRFEDTGGAVPGDLIGRNERMHELLAGRPLIPLAEGLARAARER